MPNEAPRVYANGVRITGGAYDVLLEFGFRLRDEDPEPQVLVSMSWEHAKTMIPLLQRMVENYEEQVSTIPQPESVKDAVAE